MKKILQKSLSRLHMLLLLAVMFIAGGNAAWAETETINLAGSWNGTYVTVSGTNANTMGLDAGLVVYQTYKGTVTANTGYKITRLEFTLSMGYGTPSATEGTMTSSTVWENASGSTSVTFSYYSGANVYSKIVATVVSDGGGGSTPGGDQGGTTPGGDDTPATVNSTLNFAKPSWNLSVNGDTSVPTSGCHFDTRDVFSNADGVTMTLTNVAARGEGGLNSERKGTGYAQNWPNECYYSQYTTGYFAMYFCNGEGFTINAPSGYEITNIVVNGAQTGSYPLTSLKIAGVQNSNASKGTWTGNAESVAFSTISGDANKRILVSSIEVTLDPIVESGEITYTIDLVDAPTGAYVTLDGQRFTNDDTYTVEQSFGERDLDVYEPEGYYAEVEYTRSNHTYVVTYKAYNYYSVSVTGTTDANAGIVYNETTYHNGDRIESKDVLTESSVEAAEVTSMEGNVTLAGNVFTVAYTVPSYTTFDFTKGYSFDTNGISVVYSYAGYNTKGVNVYSNRTITVSAERPIVKIVFNGLQGYSSGDSHALAINSGGGSWENGNNSTSPATWVADANTKKAVFGKDGSSDFYVSSIVVYLKPLENITYTIDLVDAPAGASVRVNNDQDFTVDGAYTTTAELTTSNITVTCPPTHYYNVAYNEGTHTFTVTFNAYNVYTIQVVGDVAGGIEYGGNEYTDEIKSEGMLTDNDVRAIDVPGYDAEVTFDGTTFTVSYTAYPTIAIGSTSSDREGNYWTSFCFKYPVSFADGVTPCIVTDAQNGVLTVEEYHAQNNEYTYDLDFTTGAYSGNSFTAMNGNLTVQGVNWIFNTGHGYAETAETDDWTTVTFTLADDFDGVIKKIRFLTAYDTNSSWFSYDGGFMDNWSEIPVNGKTMTIGAWYDQTIKHFYLDIEEATIPVFPANTGILVKSDAAKAVSYTVHEVGEENVDTSANLLQASGETGFAVSNDADHLYYKLTLNAESEAGSAGFYWGVDGGHSINVPAHKAYLKLDAATASNVRAFVFGAEGVATSIDAVATEADNAPVYNLHGQRVNATKAGIYVKNGRKYIVK